MHLNDTYSSLNECTNTTLRCKFWRLEYKDEYAVEYNLLKFFGPIVALLEIIFGFIGNSLVLIVISMNPKMRTIPNLFVLNLAIADILIVFYIPFDMIEYITPYWPLGEFLCKALPYLFVVAVFTSVYTLVFMTADRLLSVVMPLKYRVIRSKRKAFIVISVIWVTSILCMIPVYPSHVVVQYPNTNFTDCTMIQHYENMHINVALFFPLAMYVVPLALIFCMYAVILKKLWFRADIGDHKSAKTSGNNKKVTKMIVVIVAAFAICWAPTVATNFYNMYGDNEVNVTNVVLEVVVGLFVSANQCINPFIYAIMTRDFRTNLKNTFKCMCASNSVKN